MKGNLRGTATAVSIQVRDRYQLANNLSPMSRWHWVSVTLGHGDIVSRWHWVMVTLCHSDIGSRWHWVMVTLCHGDIGSQWHWVRVTLGHSDIVSRWHWVTVTLDHGDIGSRWSKATAAIAVSKTSNTNFMYCQKKITAQKSIRWSFVCVSLTRRFHFIRLLF